MKFGYADPPYIGQAKKHYGSDAEVDHAELIKHMTEDFPDGWALSCSSPSLAQIIPMLPEGCRIMAWVKPFASFKPGVNPAYAWEPVIVFGGRARGRGLPTVRDWISANITLERGLSGAKPKEFCYWLFDVLNIQLGDELIDIFPGTGAVSMALESFLGQQRLDASVDSVLSRPDDAEGRGDASPVSEAAKLDERKAGKAGARREAVR